MKVKAQILLTVPKGATEVSSTSGCVVQLMQPGAEIHASKFNENIDVYAVRTTVELGTIVLGEADALIPVEPDRKVVTTYEENGFRGREMPPESPAFKLGRQAFTAGRNINRNPFKTGSIDEVSDSRTEWNAGWMFEQLEAPIIAVVETDE